MADFKKITEQDSLYHQLEQMSVEECLININREDHKVAQAVQDQIPQIRPLVDAVVHQLKQGGRLFYIGAGTSGRLGILDASECPPTFGVEAELVTGIIAGGDQAIRTAVENAEDNPYQAWIDLETYKVKKTDVIVGIAASGTTPYVVGGVQEAKAKGLLTGCITCNPRSPLALAVDFPVEVVVGPEFVTGSSRMKAGTAQKMILNMISTSLMIQLGKVKGNKMVDMQLSNAKLNKRATQMIMDYKGVNLEEAKQLLTKYGSVRKVIENE